MKHTDLRDKTFVVVKFRDGSEARMKCNWWDALGKFLLTHETETRTIQYLLDDFGTVSRIVRYGNGADIESQTINDFTVADLRPYVPGEVLSVPKPAGYREVSLTEQLNARFRQATALTYKGRRFDRIASDLPHEWHYRTTDGLAKLIIATHPEYTVQYKHREPVYEIIEESLSVGADEFLNDKTIATFQLLTIQ